MYKCHFSPFHRIRCEAIINNGKKEYVIHLDYMCDTLGIDYVICDRYVCDKEKDDGTKDKQ